MFRSLLTFALSLLTCLALQTARPAQAHAALKLDTGLRVSLGQSIYLVEPRFNLREGCAPCYDGDRRKPTDLEAMFYLDFGIVTLDLATMFSFESRTINDTSNTSVTMMPTNYGFAWGLRPGVRIFPLLGLYVRLSLPLNLSQLTANATSTYFNINFSAGLGYELRIKKWGFFAEMNLNPALQKPWNMPIEFRIGVSH